MISNAYVDKILQLNPQIEQEKDTVEYRGKLLCILAARLINLAEVELDVQEHGQSEERKEDSLLLCRYILACIIALNYTSTGTKYFNDKYYDSALIVLGTNKESLLTLTSKLCLAYASYFTSLRDEDTYNLIKIIKYVESILHKYGSSLKDIENYYINK